MLNLDEGLTLIVKEIFSAGGKAYLVGGAVRDQLLGIPIKDYDIEVYDMSEQTLIGLLEHFGDVDCVGQSFGVIKLHIQKGQEIDFSLPRRETKYGEGHKGFEIEHNPMMTICEAASRRDFTINSMALNLQTGILTDHFCGKADLASKILRATSDKFGEDPLRVLRGMQFAGRFGMTVERGTARMCLQLRDEYDSLAKERVWTEWWKWAKESKLPSFGLKYLYDIDWLSLYPALWNLLGVEQDPEWHPEGKCFRHALLAVDAAAGIADREKLSMDDRGVLVLAALLHDVGKPSTTEMCDDGRVRARGHCEVGVSIAEEFLISIGAWPRIIKRVLPLVQEHMIHVTALPVGKRVVRRLANRLQPTTIAELLRVIEADYSARLPSPRGLPEEAKKLKLLSDGLELIMNAPEPLLLGRHLIQYFQMEPGPAFGPILKKAFQSQLDGEFTTTEEAVEWVEKTTELSHGEQVLV